MKITAQPHLAPLLAELAPAEAGQPAVGRCIDDEPDYAWLDEEMMKVGSLRHAEVDWPGAEKRAVRLLGESGKDLKVLGHLLHCLQQDGDAVRFALSLQLLSGALNGWWNDAWPFQGLKGARGRSRLFAQFSQRANKLAATLDFSGGAEAERQACQQACDATIDAAEARELPLDDLKALRRTLDDTPSRTSPAGSASNQPAATQDNASATATASVVDTARVPEVRLESGNERGNRQALLKMADFLNDQALGEPLGYRLRRHAIWHGIHALPASRDGQRTELAPVSADRAADYRERLARGADSALWQRIEASLAVGPYWLEGHRLSAEAADALGYPRCAQAIREETARFVARLPGLEALSFNDGTPFVDGATGEWLDNAPAGSAGATNDSNGEPWQVGLEEAREILVEQGLQGALGVLDAGLARARSPREHAYWRLASAELLNEVGLETLAQQHCQALYHGLADIDLAHWEPALLARLEASLKT
ncbi:type VI secretion system protein VasJ [Modicisalibacter muralis]|uniref:Type VI secretion system protein VasJ n=1 Tax=Modicisalibacter muralis TaxID=119000 RepID=A0A1G9R160_9GAMM|nr:type VI secretion system protein TssA [Halomonas muralis]SDM16871.1 type VI secretion system protein VasJ [Halomonas muralis]